MLLPSPAASYQGDVRTCICFTDTSVLAIQGATNLQLGINGAPIIEVDEHSLLEVVAHFAANAIFGTYRNVEANKTSTAS